MKIRRFIVLLILVSALTGCVVETVGVANARPAIDAGAEVSLAIAPLPSPTPTETPLPTLTWTPSPTPSPTPTVVPSPTLRPGFPVQLRIPKIGVDSYVEHVGLTEDLAMDVPSKWENVAWFELGYRPGEPGNAVIAGHLDTAQGKPAVFWNLQKLQPGDEVFVRGIDGVERRFVVDYQMQYPFDEAPVQEIFGPAPEPRLALITCNGVWDRKTRNYSHRVVVYAKAAPPAAPNEAAAGSDANQ